MGTTIPLSVLIGVAAGLALIGLALLVAGVRARRQGADPHCRKCRYNLRGLPEPRCPECGSEITPKTTVIGLTRRRPALALVGLLLLALAVWPGQRAVRNIDWYRLRPASWVVRDLADPMGNPAKYTRANNELTRRINAGNSAPVVRAIIRSFNDRPLSGASRTSLLALAGTAEARAYLEQALASPDKTVREAAVAGLGISGGAWAVPLLIPMLDDGELRVVDESPINHDFHFPDTHQARSALWGCLARCGLKGRTQNLENDRNFDVDAEIERIKEWWEDHGQDFMDGKTVPDPQVTMLFWIT